jgi:ArsR family transcriptional regulator, arsenate/arsenite/antimonite-responsive transcriptional repressor
MEGSSHARAAAPHAAASLTHQDTLMYSFGMPSLRPTLRAADQFHALSDETRLRILELLRGGEQCVCELTEALDLRQSLLSFHLKTLKEAGLVADRREGRWMYYALSPGALERLAAHLSSLAAGADVPRRRQTRCEDAP